MFESLEIELIAAKNKLHLYKITNLRNSTMHGYMPMYIGCVTDLFNIDLARLF